MALFALDTYGADNVRMQHFLCIPQQVVAFDGGTLDIIGNLFSFPHLLV